MKRFFAFAIAASLSLFVAGSAMAVPNNGTDISNYPAGAPANGVAASRHNLGAFGVHVHTASTTEICIFCHTPHHTNTTSSVKPLWNRSTTNAATLRAYGDTMAYNSTSSPNSTVATSNLGSATLACLSCHDGQTALDSIVNAPGKGGITVGGKSRGWQFQEAGNNFWNTMGNGNQVGGWSNRLNIGNLGDGGYNGTSAGLSDDHPVSIVYTPGVASLRDKTQNIAAIDLRVFEGVNVVSSGDATLDANIAQNRWAVKGYINTDATIDDLLRQNTNAVGYTATNKTVECSSCHDPHFKNLSWDEVESSWGIPGSFPETEADGLFLRRVGGNTGSGVCRTCHNK